MSTMVILLVVYLFIQSLRPKSDPREPILLRPKVPIIGHVLGLQKHGNMYMQRLIANNPPPAFTMDIIFAKYVIITSAKLLSAVQRNKKWISFEPILLPMCERMAGIHDKDPLDVLMSKETPEGPVLMTQNLNAIHP